MEIKISVHCVSCGKVQEVSVDSAGYQDWLSGKSIQYALPKSHSMERDVLITHMCLSCLSKTFNRPVPGESWGEQLGNCYCCDAPLWEKDKNDNGDLVCPNCHCNQSEEEEE